MSVEHSKCSQSAPAAPYAVERYLIVQRTLAQLSLTHTHPYFSGNLNWKWYRIRKSASQRRAYNMVFGVHRHAIAAPNSYHHYPFLTNIRLSCLNCRLDFGQCQTHNDAQRQALKMKIYSTNVMLLLLLPPTTTSQPWLVLPLETPVLRKCLNKTNWQLRNWRTARGTLSFLTNEILTILSPHDSLLYVYASHSRRKTCRSIRADSFNILAGAEKCAHISDGLMLLSVGFNQTGPMLCDFS